MCLALRGEKKNELLCILLATRAFFNPCPKLHCALKQAITWQQLRGCSTWSSQFAGLQWQLTIQFPLPGGSTSITLASHCRVNKECTPLPPFPPLLFCCKSGERPFLNSLKLGSLHQDEIIKAEAGRTSSLESRPNILVKRR